MEAEGVRASTIPAQQGPATQNSKPQYQFMHEAHCRKAVLCSPSFSDKG